MKNRLAPLVLVVVAVGLSVAACGSDDGQQSSPSSDSTLPAVATSSPVEGYEHPTGADEVVISYAELGGFLPQEFAFRQTPNALISGDGRMFMPGAQIEIYPGPLLPAVQVQTITEQGIQNVLAAADEAGLFADVDYTVESNVADASTATVTISANGETWTHEAYALGFAEPGGDESTPERQALLDFVTQLSDPAKLAGAENLGEAMLFDPTEYEIQAIRVDDLSVYGTEGIEPTVEEWPSDVSVRLADAAECTVVPAAEVGDLLESANQLTFFTDAGVTYQVLARPALPGSIC
jgi:hypothetical protein